MLTDDKYSKLSKVAMLVCACSVVVAPLYCCEYIQQYIVKHVRTICAMCDVNTRLPRNINIVYSTGVCELHSVWDLLGFARYGVLAVVGVPDSKRPNECQKDSFFPKRYFLQQKPQRYLNPYCYSSSFHNKEPCLHARYILKNNQCRCAVVEFFFAGGVARREGCFV